MIVVLMKTCHIFLAHVKHHLNSFPTNKISFEKSSFENVFYYEFMSTKLPELAELDFQKVCEVCFKRCEEEVCDDCGASMNDTCVVCQNDFGRQVSMKCCRQRIHGGCLLKSMVQGNMKCPFCRANIVIPRQVVLAGTARAGAGMGGIAQLFMQGVMRMEENEDENEEQNQAGENEAQTGVFHTHPFPHVHPAPENTTPAASQEQPTTGDTLNINN